MPQILIRNISKETVDRLKERATRNRRSLQGEVAAILDREAAISKYDYVEAARNLRERIARRGPQKTNSVDLIREERDR